MFCPNCGNQVEDGSRFCGFCGNRFGPRPMAPVQETPVQQFTQAENDAFFTQEEQVPVTYAAPVPANTGNAPGKFKLPALRLSKKSLIIGGAAVAAVILLVLIVVIASLSSGGSEPNYALYIKDSQVYYNALSGKESAQVTEDLTDGEDVDNSDLHKAADELGEAMHLTEDGKTLFYMDEIGDNATLYCRSVANFNKAPVEIASGVEEYVVCDGGKLVFYLKGGTLHRCKSPFGKENDEKIARDVYEFDVTKDGDYILYENEDSVFYVIHKGEEEKVGSDIEIEYVGDKGTVYYKDGDRLYAKAVGQKKEKLLSDVDSVFGFSEDGTFYFTRDAEMTLADFFEDNSEYEYWMKNMADEYLYFDSLHYYNGKEEILLAETCRGYKTQYSDDSIALCYSAADISTLEELSYLALEKLSDMDKYYYSSVYDVAEIMVEDALDDVTMNCVVIGGTVSQVDVENVGSFEYSPDGKTIYFLCDVDEEREEGTVYKASVSGQKVGKTEKFDDDVYSKWGFYYVGSSDYLVYYKDVEKGEGELFVNGASVDEDVYLYRSGSYNAQKDTLLFFTDYDGEKGEGTLRAYNGKKASDISDDVYVATILPNGDVVFLYDYNLTKREGTLAIYDGKTADIADDVFDYTFTPGGDVLFLYDYNTSKYRGTLAVYDGKVTELDEDVVALITITGDYHHYFDS